MIKNHGGYISYVIGICYKDHLTTKFTFAVQKCEDENMMIHLLPLLVKRLKNRSQICYLVQSYQNEIYFNYKL